MFAGGVLLFANGFVPWWYRSVTASGTITYNAGLTNWSVIAVLAGAAAAIAILARAAIWPEPAPGRDGTVYTLLGLVALVTLVANALTGQGVWLGLYAGIGLASILVLGGTRRRRERRTGWT